MAGAGYKLFNTGDVLTAAQVNTYLQEQAVMRFANATARTTALSGVLAEGMMSYLDDTNSVEVYDGSTWVSVGSTGDITGVTAGTGISGGGTSGTVTITNSMATEITAAGDIIVGTGSGTFDNLPIGTTGQVLTADTTVSPYKVKWATASSSSSFVGASVYSSTNVSVPNNTYTQVTFNTEHFDTDNFHSNTTNTSRLTIPSGKDGKYAFTFSGTSTSFTGKLIVRLYKNGSGGKLMIFANTADNSYFFQAIESAVAGDYFEVYANQNSGTTQSIEGGSTYNWFQVEYLGA